MTSEAIVGAAASDGETTPTGDTGKPASVTTRSGRERADSVLIYAPGLGRYPTNSAVGVADVIAATLDRQRAGHYRSETSSETAPRGLRPAKTILDPAGRPVLEVFELDYRERLTDVDAAGGSAAPPGLVRAVGYSIWSAVLLLRAWRRKAKSPSAKWQLFFGLAATSALLVAAVAALIAALAAMDLLRWVPSWLNDWLPTDSVDASAVAVGGGIGVAAIWAKTRSGMLRLADSIRQNLRYLGEERHRNTVTHTLGDGIDGLLDDGWTAKIHVLGYSFGSLVVVDALFPRVGAATFSDRIATALASVTTIGCPGDAVRLYFPGHFARRHALRPDVAWVNVFIPADVFASNFHDGDDGFTENPLELGGVRPISRQYTEERLSPLTILRMKGFRTHSGYWDLADHASCFDILVDGWVPALGAPATPVDADSMPEA